MPRRVKGSFRVAAIRPVDPDAAALTSPSDAIVGAFGRVIEGKALQIKGFPYALAELLGDEAEARRGAERAQGT